jgi:hypothetical protein
MLESCLRHDEVTAELPWAQSPAISADSRWCWQSSVAVDASVFDRRRTRLQNHYRSDYPPPHSRCPSTVDYSTLLVRHRGALSRRLFQFSHPRNAMLLPSTHFGHGR